jgi:hypothetical protein
MHARASNGQQAPSDRTTRPTRDARTTPHLTQTHKRAAALTACQNLKKTKRAACTATAKQRYPLTPRNPRIKNGLDHE